MARGKELKVLPSMVIYSNDNTVELDSLSFEERKRVFDKMCENISNNMSRYYTSHPENWTKFIQVMTEE